MSKRVTVNFIPLKRKITFELCSEQNQALCEAIWNALPYCSIETHTVVSGKNIYHQVPIVTPFFIEADYTIPRHDAEIGTVFLPDIQSLFFKYGYVSEKGNHPPIGKVFEGDIQTMIKVGKLCWEAIYLTKEPMIVVITREGEVMPAYQTLPFKLIEPKTLHHPIMQTLLHKINTAIEQIWVYPPQEVLSIFDGKSKNRPGSYGQFLSTLIVMAGEVRNLTGLGTLGGLLKTCQSAKSDLQILKIMTMNLHFPTEFLGYCGLNTLWQIAETIFDNFDTLVSKDEYFSIISSFALYINQLNIWILHYFPWSISDQLFSYSTLET